MSGIGTGRDVGTFLPLWHQVNWLGEGKNSEICETGNISENNITILVSGTTSLTSNDS